MIVAGSIVTLILCLLVLWRLPIIQVAALKGIEDKDRFALENEARRTLVQIVGGAVVVGGLWFSGKTLLVQLKTLETQNQTLKVTKAGQLHERFGKAIELLGAEESDGQPKIQVRLGGIYALAAISKDSDFDPWPVMEILTMYLRDNAHRVPITVAGAPSLRFDFQAILTVVGSRDVTRDPKDEHLRLQYTVAPLAHLQGLNFASAYFGGSDLKGAFLANCHLEGAFLDWEIHLEGADLKWAKLQGAHFSTAHLDGAHLEGADLTGARDLTPAQIASAFGNRDTKLPVGMKPPEAWLRD